jgi:hypothetical protein
MIDKDLVVVSKRAQVPIAKTGHRIFNERDGLACGVLALQLTGDIANIDLAEPTLSAGSILGRNDDYNPPFFSLSPIPTFPDGIDATAEELELISTNAWSVGAPPDSKAVLGFWQRSKYAKLLMKARTKSRDVDISYAEAQRKKEIYLGKLRQLEFEVKSGKLGDLQTMYAETFNCAMEFRDALTGLASREVPAMSPTVKVDPVTGKVDPIDLMIKIEGMHRRFLEQLAKTFRRLAERAGKADGDGS